MKRQETWECDDFPRARLSFERAPYFRPTHFASVGNILKAVDEENRVTLVIAISVLQFGQILVVGTTENARLTVMTLPSARQMSGRAKKAHPGLGACQSEKQELEIARSLRQRLDHRHGAPIIHKSREKSFDAIANERATT